MNKKPMMTLAVMIVIVFMGVSARAVPSQINFQGRLVDSDTGEPVTNQDLEMVFRIYDDEMGGSMLWEETQTVSVDEGIYDVALGLVTPLDSTVFSEDTLWLEVEVNTEVLAPRQQLTSVPFAMKAGDANTLDGLDSSALNQTGHVTDTGNPHSVTAAQTGAATVSDITWNNLSGKPAGFADNTDDTGITTETDPTVAASLKDGITWTEVSNRPSGLDDGDDVGMTAESDYGRQNVASTLYEGATSLSAKYVNSNTLVGETMTATNAVHVLKVDQNGTGIAINAESDGPIGIKGNSSAPDGAGVAGYGHIGLFGQALNVAGYAGHFLGNVKVDEGNITVQGVDGFNAAGEEGVVYLGAEDNYIKGVHGEGVKIGTYGVGDVVAIDQSTGRVHISSPVNSWGTLVIKNSNPGNNEATIGFVKGSDAGGGEQWFAGVGAWGETDNFVIGRGAPKLTITPEGHVKVPVLEITGGADLSEQFDIRSIREDLLPKPGMVVSIDPDNPGDLLVSSKAYDRRVAGIISGAGGVKPGMLMGQEGTEADGANPVALTGRVYCFADASKGAIEPGDLLTTSDTPGHAMKVGDHTKAQGAIIGKAMSSLETGTELVLVLVSLQ